MEIKTTTLNNRVVVSLLVLGFTLMAMPLSVFSQESTTASDATVETQKEQQSDVSKYDIELLEDNIVRGDFVVGPGKVDVSLEPGQSKVVNMIVTNRMGEVKVFKFEVEDIQGGNDDGQAVVLLGDDRGPYTLKDYISIPNMEFELQHMERATIPVTITLPADAEPGGRYGSVLVSTVSRDADLDGANTTAPSSAIVSRIGTLFFVSTPGNTDITGKLAAFSTLGSKKVYSEGPIDFGLVFENTGSVHLNPYGEITITNMAGAEVGFVEIDPWFALPQSLRTREIQWNKELLFGRYTATVRINRGYDDIVDEASLTFWVLPWKPLTGAFLVLVVFFLTLRFIASRFEFKRKE
jgi:hypothetical protein